MRPMSDFVIGERYYGGVHRDSTYVVTRIDEKEKMIEVRYVPKRPEMPQGNGTIPFWVSRNDPMFKFKAEQIDKSSEENRVAFDALRKKKSVYSTPPATPLLLTDTPPAQ